MNPLENHVTNVVDKTWNYAGRCQTWNDHVMNAVTGLGGEAGEIVDLHKKMFFHTEKDTSFWREKLLHEFGDLFFYAGKLLQLHSLTLEECLEANKKKLASRHPELGEVTTRFGEGYIK